MSKIKCMICGKEFKWLPGHVRIHDINIEEYCKRFPDAKIMADGLNHVGKNNPAYGKPAWNKGLTKETDKRVEKYSGERPSSRPDIKERHLGKKWEEIWGIEKASEMKKKSSEKRKRKCVSGEIVVWNKGLTKETDERVALYGEKESKLKKGNSKYAIITLRNRGKGGLRPNKLEKEIASILNTILPHEYKYVGNGDFVVEGMIPDFVNINGKKKVIEANGSYWHERSDEEIRIANFKKYGYDCLVIWDFELEDKRVVVNKILNFHGLPSQSCSRQLTIDDMENRRWSKFVQSTSQFSF